MAGVHTLLTLTLGLTGAALAYRLILWAWEPWLRDTLTDRTLDDDLP